MIQKRIDAIVADDLQALVNNGVREGRTIDYKRELPGGSDGEKKEFLADVSSFANAAGGDLVYGVVAKDGVPESIPGLADFNEDKERLRLESTIRDGVEPRVPRMHLKVIPGFPNGPVLVLRVPRSWSAPHMVTFKGSSRFFSRNSAGKFLMDVTEIRTAFEAAGDLPERIRRWRDERLGRIVANEGPMLLASSACLVVHLIPLESLTNPWRFDANDFRAKSVNFRPLGASGWDERFNVDGLLTFSVSRENRNLVQSYTQLFRSGRIEAVNAHCLDEHNGNRFLASVWYEREILGATQAYLTGLEALGVDLPIVFLLAIMGAKGAWMGVNPIYVDDCHPIDRDLSHKGLHKRPFEREDSACPRVCCTTDLGSVATGMCARNTSRAA